MKRVISLIVAISFLFLFLGAANAFNVEEHVKYAPNSEGDMLIFPWYWASPGVNTVLTITNTSDSHCSVVKVVMRSPKFSTEMMDWFVYLSPKDKWEGKLYNKNGDVYLYSEDDSILYQNSTFASSNYPVDQKVFGAECDTNEYGYIEAIEAASWVNGTVVNDRCAVVPKNVVKSIYEAKYTGKMIPTENTHNIITGKMVFNVPSLNLSSMMRADVFEDWDNRKFLTKFLPTGLLKNRSNNFIGELEAALSKDQIAMNFINDGTTATAHWLTFPTKFTDLNNCECNGTKSGDNVQSKFFNQLTKPCQVPFQRYDYDMSENCCGAPPESPWSGNYTETSKTYLPHEVNLRVSFCEDLGFAKGWRDYKFGQITDFETRDGQPGTFSGAPVLPSMLYVDSNGMSLTKGAWDDGSVSVNATAGTKMYYPNYQYSDFVDNQPDPTRDDTINP